MAAESDAILAGKNTGTAQGVRAENAKYLELLKTFVPPKMGNHLHMKHDHGCLFP